MFKWDYLVDGVTSISFDIHKYGFASKGVSVSTFASSALRRFTYCPVTSGNTLYISPTMQGSRGGAVMAAAWATMLHIGDEGYCKTAEHMYKLHKRLKDEIKGMGGVKLLVDSDLCIVPIASDEFDVYAIATLMDRHGWNTFTACRPKCLYICIGERHDELLDLWLDDLKLSIDELRADPNIKVEGDSAVYGAASVLPSELLETMMMSYMDIKLSVKPR